jgi:hypothetical protein
MRKNGIGGARQWAVGSVFLIALFSPGVLQAYIDPGTGSMLLQAIIAMIIGALYPLKRLWDSFRKRRPRDGVNGQ